MVNRNKNHDARCRMQGAGLGSEDSPMFTGCFAPSAFGVGQFQSLMFKVQSWEVEVVCGARFEDSRLKTICSENVDAKKMKGSRTKTEDPEGWTPSGERHVAEFEVAGVEG